MGARVIELSRVAGNLSTAVDEQSRYSDREGSTQRFQFWRGASGERYIHTLYGLIECPEVPRATYMLVRRDAAGRRRVLFIGRASNDAPSLNLAEIRQRGAQLGANEVHVHFVAESERQRNIVEFDLKARHGSKEDKARSSRVKH